MKQKESLFVPLVGKTSACRQKEGLKQIKKLPLLPRLTAVLSPQGREMRRGFTLIELLVVVLIIGILSAIAVPQYQKAVLKSRYSALMPIAKSIADGNEVYYLEHGMYATSPANLDVTGQDDYPDGTELDMSTGDYSFVLAGRDNNFPMNYIVYQNHSPKFAGNIHCEADENNTMAQEVCQSLGGQYIPGSQTDGFMTYVLSGTQTPRDAFPTSIAKLKAQLCANVSEANCLVDEETKTITVKDCLPTTDSYILTSQKQTCVNNTYDTDGNPLGTTYTVCNRLNSSDRYGKIENGQCVPGNSRTGIPYEETFSDPTYQTKTEEKICASFDSETRNCRTIRTIEYASDGSYMSVTSDCHNGGFLDNSTGACSTGSTPTQSMQRYDSHNNPTYNAACATYDTPGTCSSYQSEIQWNNSYASDGKRSYTKRNCIAWGTEGCETWKNTDSMQQIYNQQGEYQGYRKIVCWGTVLEGECDRPWSLQTYDAQTQQTDGFGVYCTKGVDWVTATCLE